MTRSPAGVQRSASVYNSLPGSWFETSPWVALTASLLTGMLASTLPHVQLAAVLLTWLSSWLPKDAHRAADGDEAGVAHVNAVCCMAVVTVLVTAEHTGAHYGR